MQFPKKWLQGNTLGELITSELRLKIVSGQIPKDIILSENQIAKEFKTSRSPVREAFKTLSTEGLVSLARMGAVVLGLTQQDIDELYDVRFMLENFASQRILPDFNEEKAVKFNRILDMMELAANHNDHMEFSYHDLLFHETIIIEADHKRIFHFWNNVRHIVLCFLIVATEKRFSENKKQIKAVLEGHRLLVETFLTKDSTRLQNLIEDHFLDTRKTVVNAYFNRKNN